MNENFLMFVQTAHKIWFGTGDVVSNQSQIDKIYFNWFCLINYYYFLSLCYFYLSHSHILFCEHFIQCYTRHAIQQYSTWIDEFIVISSISIIEFGSIWFNSNSIEARQHFIQVHNPSIKYPNHLFLFALSFLFFLLLVEQVNQVLYKNAKRCVLFSDSDTKKK